MSGIWLRIASSFTGAAIGSLAGRWLAEQLGVHLPWPVWGGILAGGTVAGFMWRHRHWGR